MKYFTITFLLYLREKQDDRAAGTHHLKHEQNLFLIKCGGPHSGPPLKTKTGAAVKAAEGCNQTNLQIKR